MKKKDRKLLALAALGFGAWWLLNRKAEKPPVKNPPPRTLPGSSTTATRGRMSPAEAVAGIGLPYTYNAEL